ncbi:peptidylprolyl isomerase [Paraoerskovia marina]|uniref:peptidylprolyl isomerase n=1 Tax=Paraoerskovia marina TaxID=545619 RepID=A0A1H1R6N1_9CELL|nr:FKBP-type peptidyl-prolyl cis-trans isomerase [Paraoerskovia marina]SDS31391.1 peptidylprolyl isomerase [Paraoerskovia marina]
MKNRTMRGLAALAVGSALVLSGCSSDGDADGDATATESASTDSLVNANEDDVKTLEAVEVSGDVGSEPEVTFDAPLEVSGPTAVVSVEGDGEPLEEGMRVTMDYVLYDGTGGERVQGTWDEGQTAETFTLGDPAYELLNDTFIGTPVGSRVSFANQSQDADGNATTALSVIELSSGTEPSGLERAEGEAVTPEDGLPTVTLGDDGSPSIEIPDGYEAPDEMVVQTLIKGDGPEVSADQSITAHYTGWTLDGETFDSSWERGEPADFALTGVIEGWTEGLSGQTVGSQVLLVIPPAQAYGAVDGNELQDETLIFVVDILDAY